MKWLKVTVAVHLNTHWSQSVVVSGFPDTDFYVFISWLKCFHFEDSVLAWHAVHVLVVCCVRLFLEVPHTGKMLNTTSHRQLLHPHSTNFSWCSDSHSWRGCPTNSKCVCVCVLFEWTWYLYKSSREPQQEHLLGQKNVVIRFWRSKVTLTSENMVLAVWTQYTKTFSRESLQIWWKCSLGQTD